MTDAAIPTIDETQLNTLGMRLRSMFERHETDRKAAEDRWLQNLRQFRGIYDPEILSMIPRDCSKAYPKLTRWKVIGTVARLMQMLFPQTEKNWGIKPSPIPDLTMQQLQGVLNDLVQAKAEAQQIPPAQVQCSDEEIEKAIEAFAKGKAEQMEKKIDDDLQEMGYPTLARKVVFSATLYNVGLLTGPMHTKVKGRTWQRNQFTGAYTAIERDEFKPLYEFLSVWNWYPDMTATALDKQDDTFERQVMTRWQVEELAKRPDFMAERVNKWLRDHKDGNYRERHWESSMRGEKKSDHTTNNSKDSRKYEVIFHFGGMTGHELQAAGIAISDEDLGKTLQVRACMIDNIVIKVKLAPFGSDVRHHHEFVFEEDDLNLLGNGLCDTLRDSQLSLCETVRAALDNASVIGPMVEVNQDLLMPGQDMTIRKNKVWQREGEGNAAVSPAVRNITIDSHLTEITALAQVFLDFADKESGLPPPSLGDVSGGGSEALRTQQNASMFLGAAALPIRDTVRNFDVFTVSVIGGLEKWNKKYAPDVSRDGDFNIIPRGSTSLIAKEVQGQALDIFRTTITPDEQPHIKTRGLLMARARAHDIPVEDIMEDEDTANKNIQAQQQQTQKLTQEQSDLIKAQAGEAVAKALLNAAQAKKAEGSISIDMFNTIIDALAKGDKGTADQMKAHAAIIKANQEPAHASQ